MALLHLSILLPHSHLHSPLLYRGAAPLSSDHIAVRLSATVAAGRPSCHVQLPRNVAQVQDFAIFMAPAGMGKGGTCPPGNVVKCFVH